MGLLESQGGIVMGGDYTPYKINLWDFIRAN